MGTALKGAKLSTAVTVHSQVPHLPTPHPPNQPSVCRATIIVALPACFHEAQGNTVRQPEPITTQFLPRSVVGNPPPYTELVLNAAKKPGRPG